MTAQYGIPTCCSGPGPAKFSGDPNYRDDKRRSTPRRRTYFNDSLHEISVKIQHPSLITFTDFVYTLIVFWALYNFALAATKTKEILMDWDVGSYCFGRGVSFAQCGRRYVGYLGHYVFWKFLGEVVPWAVIGVVVAFLGEEVIRMGKGLVKGKTA
ncbi:hypothetical protein QBC35DRAFT_535862 [Podospora australis]|uniref:Uncharacterized protein n=1 Tax=Podospora australis TaxID=1536484 RepID=A0AAN7AC72_9PEZI|nr:hypothetical protein QBC35DRAFT_535862 [Podospora australis]